MTMITRAILTHIRRRCIATHLQQCIFYGTRTQVELHPPPTSSPLSPYLRTCLTSDISDTQNMEFCLSFIGTSSGSATMHRNGSCLAFRLGGETYLFDCSEGSTRQLIHSRINMGSITKIFISHLHGDHIYGIVPVILEVQVAIKLMKQAIEANPRRNKKRRHQAILDVRPTLEIYGPPGLYNYIAMTLALSCAKMNYLEVVVTELVGGREERGPVMNASEGMGNGRRGRRNVFLSHYPEVETGLLKRRYLEMNDDANWVISSPQSDPKSLESDVKVQRNGFIELPNDVQNVNRQMHITAAELDHLKGVQTFGYMVEELTPPGTIDATKAKALGVQPSKKYSLLKCGVPTMNDDGSALIQPSDVLLETFRARKFTFLADHRRVPPPMLKLCAGSDVLIHEATLSIKDGMDKIKIRGHSNAHNAGVIGRQSECQVVALNHFAGVSANSNEDAVEEIVKEAQNGNGGASQIVASYDFMELLVPRGGFKFNPTRQTKEVDPNSKKEIGEESLLQLLSNTS